jgi:sugar phosphate isomerase/epimerase
MNLNRRHFLGVSGAVFLVGACGSAGSPATPQRKIEQIGIQTYTLRAALAEDFVGTFQMIKDVGYDYVELNRRNFVERTPTELKTLLDDIGLPSPITHLDYDMFATRTTEIGDIAGELGCEHAILPWLTEDQRTLDGYKAHAEMLNRAGEVLKSYGVTVGYHNHQFEFFDLGGSQSGMEILLSETDPDNVAFELDLFWVALTGTDIVALFNKHSGRFKYCHVKDLTGDASAFRESVDFEAIVATHMANVGEGDLPFESYFAAADIAGLEYYIAEHDNPPLPYRQSVETSYNSMKAMRF